MAAITTAVNRARQDIGLMSLPMDTGAGTIPKGGTVMLDATGAAVNGADTTACVFMGVAIETKTFAGSADGDTEIVVDQTGIWTFAFGAGNAAATSVGLAVYITDNNTVDVVGTTTYDVKVGVIVEYIDADTVKVRINEAVPSVGV